MFQKMMTRWMKTTTTNTAKPHQGTKMSIPGSLMGDEAEEEDPLRAPSPPRRATRKARSSVSVDVEDKGI